MSKKQNEWYAVHTDKTVAYKLCRFKQPTDEGFVGKLETYYRGGQEVALDVKEDSFNELRLAMVKHRCTQDVYKLHLKQMQHEEAPVESR